MDPTRMSVVFNNETIGSVNMGTPNPHDIAFNSVTNGGSLKYSTPSLTQMYQGSTKEDFNTFSSITYVASLISFSETTMQMDPMTCKDATACTIRFSREYTPILHQISPQIVYNGSDISFWVDPRKAQARQDVVFQELPFYKVLVDGYGVDFEAFVDENTYLGTYTQNQIRGSMGDIAPNNASQIDFQFRVGYA